MVQSIQTFHFFESNSSAVGCIFHAKPLAEKRHFLPIISAPKHTPNIMYLSMVGTYPSPVVAKRASGNGSREEVVLAVAGACPPGAMAATRDFVLLLGALEDVDTL